MKIMIDMKKVSYRRADGERVEVHKKKKEFEVSSNIILTSAVGLFVLLVLSVIFLGRYEQRGKLYVEDCEINGKWMTHEIRTKHPELSDQQFRDIVDSSQDILVEYYNKGKCEDVKLR